MATIHFFARVAASCAVVCLAASAVLTAAVPEPPLSVEAKGYRANGLKDGVRVPMCAVDFRWMPNPAGDAAQGYRIYRCNPADPGWKLVATTPGPGYRLTETVLPLDGREYYFYITAYNADGESRPDRKLRVSFAEERQQGSLVFSTAPVTRVPVGTAYRYDADAVARNGEAVVYDMRTTADGATIDRETGLVTWTPTRAGEYKFVIQATLRDDPSKVAAQTWALRVGENGGTSMPVFVNAPVEDATVGMPYAFDAEVRHSDDNTVQFALEHAPEGAQVDARTGLVQWTPAAAGEYRFVLKAAVENTLARSQAFLGWVVRVENTGAAAVATTVGTDEAVLHATVYPNPSAADLLLKFEADGRPATVVLFDPAGMEVYRNEYATQNGATVITLDATRFAAGLYFARIETGGRSQTLPLTILR